MIHNLNYESDLWERGINKIAGIDEVGRGCLAGPIVTASVSWDKNYLIYKLKIIQEILRSLNIISNPITYKDFRKLQKELDETQQDLLMLLKINDSKKIPEKMRDRLSEFIRNHSNEYFICEIDASEIDKNGINHANLTALKNAALGLKDPEYLLIDHFKISDNIFNEKLPYTAITKGDYHSFSIASASIVAKVYRDNLMRTTYHEMYPQYGFDKNVGYGTSAHIEAIRAYGYTPIHRRTFKTKIDDVPI